MNAAAKNTIKTLRARTRKPGSTREHTSGMTLIYETRYADYAQDFQDKVRELGGEVYGVTRPMRRKGSVKSAWHAIEFTISPSADAYLCGGAKLIEVTL